MPSYKTVKLDCAVAVEGYKQAFASHQTLTNRAFETKSGLIGMPVPVDLLAGFMADATAKGIETVTIWVNPRKERGWLQAQRRVEEDATEESKSKRKKK